jgi:ubiquinone/menaquinone biosynthesis C-methylase UbiE
MTRRMKGTVEHQRAWDRRAEHYDRAMAPLEWIAFDAWRRRLARSLPGGGRRLEVATGTGANLPYIVEGTTVAFDLSLAMLAGARERAGGRGKVFLVAADAAHLPLRERSFDSVSGAFVFCGLPEPDAALSELRRVTRPGGEIAFLEHTLPTNRFLAPLFRWIDRFTAPRFGEHFARPTGALIARSGFRDVSATLLAGSVVQMIRGRAPADI